MEKKTLNRNVRKMGKSYYEQSASPQNLNGPVSKSLLWQFVKSPYKWFMGKPKEETENMRFGSLVHALCFSPEIVKTEYVVSAYEDFRTKEAREWRDEKTSKGVAVIKEADWMRAEDIKATVMDSEYMFSLGACDYEVAAFGKIGDTVIKGMIDIFPHSGNSLVDLKTTCSIDDERDMASLFFNLG